MGESDRKSTGPEIITLTAAGRGGGFVWRNAVLSDRSKMVTKVRVSRHCTLSGSNKALLSCKYRFPAENIKQVTTPLVAPHDRISVTGDIQTTI